MFGSVGFPAGYILKPQSEAYKQLPDAEHLSMSMARSVGISVVPFSLINVNSQFTYITKRIVVFLRFMVLKNKKCKK